MTKNSGTGSPSTRKGSAASRKTTSGSEIPLTPEQRALLDLNERVWQLTVMVKSLTNDIVDLKKWQSVR